MTAQRDAGFAPPDAPTDAQIDLGELSTGPDATTDARELTDGWSPRARAHDYLTRWRRLGRHRRAALAVLVAAAVAATANASTAPTPPPLVPQYTLTADRFLVDEQRLYAISEQPQGSGGTLTAHRLADGEELWRTTVPGPDSYLYRTEEMLLIRHYGDHDADADADPGLAGAGLAAMTSGIVPETGDVRWTMPGGFVDWDGESVLIRHEPDLSGAVPQHRISLLDARSGRLRWTYPADDAQVTRSPGRTALTDHRVLVLHDDGELVALDRADGTPTTRRTRTDAEVLHPTEQGILLTWQDDRPGIELRDPDTLERRWSVNADRDTDLLSPMDCGEFACLLYRDGRIEALDQADGTVRWSLSRESADEAGPPSFPTVYHAGPDRALMGWHGSRAEYAETWLVDTDTGEALTRFPGWGLGPRPGGDPATRPPGSGVPMLAAAPDGTGLFYGELRLPAAAGATRVDSWTRLDGVEHCSGATDAYLVCGAGEYGIGELEVTVWQVRR